MHLLLPTILFLDRPVRLALQFDCTHHCAAPKRRRSSSYWSFLYTLVRSLIINLWLCFWTESNKRYQKKLSMKLSRHASILLLAATLSTAGANLYDLSAIDIDGNNASLAPYKGTVSLVINVATNWGTTKANYECMQSLQKQYEGKPVNLLLFPCNQFLFQEPGENR